MKPSIIALCVAVAFPALGAQAASWQPSPGHTQVPIWPGVAPGARSAPDSELVATESNPVAGKPWIYVRNVSRPTLTV